VASVRRHRVIDAPAERVWAVVGDPGALATWFEGIESCTVEGDLRTAVIGSGLPMPERVVTNDPCQRRFQYRIEAPLFRSHLSTIDVIELDPQRCMVVYSVDAEPAPLALVIAGAAEASLANLAALCHGDEGRSTARTGHGSS
jgi:hypothetical protein